jgi:hypothetical protein
MHAARDRFTRFAPLLAQLFPELAESRGQIESALLPVPALQKALDLPDSQGRLWVKADHSLPVAGSIKARGGFHEVLEVAEQLALKNGLLQTGSDYRALAGTDARALFAGHQIAVGSTGNLGMAIGVLAAALGFRSVVHMSTEAKEWKKQRLRQRGVDVIEHAGDYEQAVASGRTLALADPLMPLCGRRAIALALHGLQRGGLASARPIAGPGRAGGCAAPPDRLPALRRRRCTGGHRLGAAPTVWRERALFFCRAGAVALLSGAHAGARGQQSVHL